MISKRREIVVWACLLTITGGAMKLAFNVSTAPATTLQPRAISGTIRCCWQVLSGGHHHTGFQVHRKGGNIVLTYPPATKVGHLIVASDETYTGKGITGGASVGVSRSVIRCARYGKRVSCNTLAPYSAGNFWISGLVYD